MNKITSNQSYAIFLFALLVLIVNDFYLKFTFHNIFTGKLSDFTGLLIFPWFWSLIFPKQAKVIYLGTGLLFVFWKLDASSPIINFINEQLGTSFFRVIDFSDLIALIILPVSFQFFQKSNQAVSHLKLSLKIAISPLAIFAFLATSQPVIIVEPNWEFSENYVLSLSKENILKQRMNTRLGTTNVDSLILVQDEFRFDYSGRKYRFTFNAAVQHIDSSKSIINLLKLVSYSVVGVSNEKKDALSREGFLKIFESEAIENLKDSKSLSLWYFSEKQD